MDYFLAIGIVLMFTALFVAGVYILVHLAEMAWTLFVEWMNK